MQGTLKHFGAAQCLKSSLRPRVSACVGPTEASAFRQNACGGRTAKLYAAARNSKAITDRVL
jgi:hypothetical protein